MASKSVLNKAPSAAEYSDSLVNYQRLGEQRLSNIGNRGPVILDANGKLDQKILDAYWAQGFYIFEGVVSADEVAELRAGVNNILDNAPRHSGSTEDAQGRPAFGQKFKRNPFIFITPLSDPWGGTQLLNGRHQSKMAEPTPARGAPEEVVHLIGGMCQSMDAGLRIYGHPQLLTIAEAINGVDFVPYNDVIFVKQPGLGGSVAWHQDGVTHWESPDWDEGIHGFNFQVQLYACTAANCLWVVPGTHKMGKIDILDLIEKNGGSEQLAEAVPLTCEAGDVTIVNRQTLHGSFANASPDPRVSLTFGFHRRKSILGQCGALSQNDQEVYDEQRIFDRSTVIALAIDARQQYYSGESRYDYQPFAGLEGNYQWDPDKFDELLLDYNLKDLSI
ncbi:MAG: phytanoyl-CoA dioxygenase family protein [bacterium]|nr:phytanoyl-CoA dioxygenase [Gammaproteobacteria bacterium]